VYDFSPSWPKPPHHIFTLLASNSSPSMREIGCLVIIFPCNPPSIGWTLVAQRIKVRNPFLWTHGFFPFTQSFNLNPKFEILACMWIYHLQYELGVGWKDMGTMEKWDLEQSNRTLFRLSLLRSLSEWKYSLQRVTQLLLHVSFVPSANSQTLVSYFLIPLLTFSVIVMIISFP
jgi:hypothetical protein